MFGLHETSRGSSYVPPAILVHLSQLHKKGTLYTPQRKPAPPAVPKTDAPKSESLKPSPSPNPLPVKIFFAATALALTLSTCTGIVMAWKYARRKLIVAGVLLAGVACPLTLLLL